MRKIIQAVTILIFILVTASITLFIAIKITKGVIAKITRAQTDGAVEFRSDGFKAGSYSLPRTTFLQTKSSS